MVDFTRSPRELELEERTQRFIREVVIPYESDPRLAHGISEEIVREMRAKARAAGLLALQAPREWGGAGLDHRETATLLRAAELYAAEFGTADGRIPATFQIVTLTGWRPAANQQKALRPGSAAQRLADALGAPEHSAGEKAGR